MVSAPVVRAHNRIVLSEEPEASRPSGSTHSALAGSTCPSRRVVSALVAGSHNRIVLSKEAEASRPSSSTHSALTESECPSRRAVSVLVVGSHNRIVLSSEPDASRPSGSTHSHARWLTAQKFTHPAQQIVFQDQMEAIKAAQVRLATLEQQLRDIVPTWTMAPVVAAYQALRGVSFLVAAIFVAQIGDIRRFNTP
jgi:hypothetical protein